MGKDFWRRLSWCRGISHPLSGLQFEVSHSAKSIMLRAVSACKEELECYRRVSFIGRPLALLPKRCRLS